MGLVRLISRLLSSILVYLIGVLIVLYNTSRTKNNNICLEMSPINTTMLTILAVFIILIVSTILAIIKWFNNRNSSVMARTITSNSLSIVRNSLRRNRVVGNNRMWFGNLNVRASYSMM